MGNENAMEQEHYSDSEYVCSLISASMFSGLTKQLVKIAKNRTEKQVKVRFLFQILLFLHHDNGFRTYR